MTQRAASCTVEVAHPEGNQIFIFVNRPNTDWIDYIRLDAKDPLDQQKAQAGKIGTKLTGIIKASSGPLSCIAMPCQPGPASTMFDIRLYFVANSTLVEAKLVSAGPRSDMSTGWVLTDNTRSADNSLNIMNLNNNNRAIDQSSYMSSGKTREGQPYAIWQALGQPSSTDFACFTKEGRWTLNTLPVTLDRISGSAQ